jgi:hypothetical protein
MPDVPPYPGSPRWVKVTGIIAGLLVLVFVGLLHAGIIGRHGPGLHGLHSGHSTSGEHPQHAGRL